MTRSAVGMGRALAFEGPKLLVCGNAPTFLLSLLPTPDALALCEKAGLEPSHITAMQGPFNAAINAALYDQLAIRAMVSKASGVQGGVAEKVIPALERDIHVIMIDRPKE